jgi:photosystem II stability/assembly factor-like uncharacterized protein
MLKTTLLYLLLCCGCFLPLQAQQETPAEYGIRALTQGPVKSIRGMSVINDSILWVSGTGGMVGKSTDAGLHWQWARVSGCDSCDWRDIEAFNDQEALVINAGEPAHIFRTANGGNTWERVYFNDTKGIFFDGIEFRNPREGWAIGDPLGGKFTILYTRDGGRNWSLADNAPAAYKGEAIFAASGSSLRSLPGGIDCFVTGGDTARFLKYSRQHWQSFALPILQGSSSTGPFSVAFLDARQGVALGGDYRNDTLRRQNCVLTTDGGRTWSLSAVPPMGYRSCVNWTGPRQLVATGTSGTDLSSDGGRHWQLISREGFHVVQRARHGQAVYLAGSEGRIARLVRNK